MIDFKSKLDKDADVSVEEFEKFHTFLDENLFKDIPEGTEIELYDASTSLSYLKVRYHIRMPRNHNVLSLIILGAKSLRTKGILRDYLRSNYAIVSGDFKKMVTGIRILEDNFEPFKKAFDNYILPTYEKNRWEK